MVMRTFKYISVLGLLVAMLSCIPAHAQDQPADNQQDQQQGQSQPQQPQQTQPSQPIPAIRSPLASAADNGDATPSPQDMVPDTRPLTGAENISVGSMPAGHSYWQPRVSLVGTADSNPQFLNSNASWGAWIALLGGVDLHKVSGVSDLFVSYTGGGMFSNDSDAPNGDIQALTVRDKYLFRRSTFTLIEVLSYLPESSYGFAGLQFAGVSPGAAVSLGTGFTPSQSILTPRGQNLSNTSDAEFDTRLTARTTVTFVAGYSFLRYFDDDLADFGYATFQAGYNYQLNRKDTIGVSYQFGAFRYSNLDQSINANTIQASYGRRVTGRLAFQIAAGPQFVSSRFPITSSTSLPSSGSVSQVYWTLNTSLQYQLRRTQLGAGYYHGVTGGSGLLAGAKTDIASGSLNQQISRTFNASVSAGFSRNQGIPITTGAVSQTYDYWFAGVNLTRSFGRNLDIFGNYQLQYQNGVADCTNIGCAPNVTRHQISLGVNLHRQPIPF